MATTEQEFLRQLNEARNIENSKLREWEDRTKKLLPVYVAEYLFHRKTGIVSEMLQIDEEHGFLYDPTILKQGIEVLLKIAEGQKNKGAEYGRFSSMYLNMADPYTRILYFRRIIDQLDIYPSIGQNVIKDMRKFAETCQDEEFLELLEGRIRNIEAREKMQRKELEEKFGRQPQ